MKKEKLFLSEDLDNLDIIADEDMESVVAIPPVMAAEYKLAKRREKLIKDRFKEQDKLKNSKDAFTGRTDKKIKNLEKLNLTESFFIPEDLSKHAEELAESILDFLNRTSEISNLDEYLDEFDLDHLSKATDALYYFANNYKPDSVESLKEGKHEEQEPLDLWTRVYNELATDIAPSEAKFREVPAPRGSRYNEMATDVNGNIIVYSPTDEDLDFARKVCDHYNCKYKVKEDTNKKTNAYYKYFMVIEVPEEE